MSGGYDTVKWVRLRVRVVGLVQGVSYRKSAQANANSLALSGWARNEPDGSVTLEFEGTDPKVDAMLDWCRVGPDHARVDNVVVLKLNPGYDRSPFVIRG